MNIPTKFREYIWLLNTIRKAKRITFAEINEKWRRCEMSGGVEMSRATFNRNKIAIEDMFGLIIDCDRKHGYKYFIYNEEILKEESVQKWLLSTLSVSNIISESLSLQKRILLETVPFEKNYLPMVIEAMKRNVRIAVKYMKYGDEVPKNLNFEPYCLKLFRQRWYVLGHFHRDVKDGPDVDFFGMFSFDRILDMSLTDVKFQIDPDFDAKTFFSECYGVLVNDDTGPVRIVIRVYGYEQYYVKDLPIHHSQQEMAQGDDYTDFELFLRPTPDFIRHIISLGNQVQVLSPKWLAEEISQEHFNAFCLYEETDE